MNKRGCSTKRSGEYHFEPGQEMQHDTSPHRLTIGGKTLTAQCAALTLAYSRRLFVRYYLRYTRLEAKHFLQPSTSCCRPRSSWVAAARAA